VAITATYPGADAQTVQDTVTQVIEQNMNGIDNLMYMSSTSDSAGSVTITLTFESGTDPDIAQVQVQNKLQLAMPLLPQGCSSRDWRREIQQQLPVGRRLCFDNKSLTRMTSLTMSHRTSKMPSAERPASAMFSCLAPSTPCASGSTAMR
jgi:multidrug efflux pump subunit AcrB